MDPGTAMLLIPEKLHAGVDNSDGKMCILHNYKLLYTCLFTPSQQLQFRAFRNVLYGSLLLAVLKIYKRITMI